MKLLFSLVLLFQSVKMTEDFLPLQTGNRWVYDVASEAGEKLGQLDFSVNERTIVAGRSLYLVSGFPFAGESAGPVRMIGYDREGRQFIRISADQEVPLFPGDSQSTEVLQSDAEGIPQKFALRTASTTLIFQRGIGIVEARMQTADGIHIAKIATSSIGKSVPVPPPAAAAGLPTAAALSAADPAAPVRVPVPNVTAATAENPVLVLGTDSDPAGMKLELMVVNTVDKLLPFRFNSSKSYDFVITDPATDREIWRWSHGMLFGQVIRTESIRASGKWTFSEVWNLRDNERAPVPAGKYRLVGILASQPPIETQPVMIEVPAGR